MREPLEGESTVVLATSGPAPVRLVLSGAWRPWRDAVVDYLVAVSGDGLEAEAGVTSLEGDSLEDYLSGLAADFRGWVGIREWRSLEGQFGIDATWANRGRVTLRFRLRPPGYAAGWEVSAEFEVDAGAEMEALSAEVAGFFAATR